jgi:hypothetical protein
MSAGYFKIPEGTLEEKDVEAIVHQRRAMFFDMGIATSARWSR